MSDNNSPFDGDLSKYTTTLKGGAGYDAPWIVVRSNSVPDLKSDVGALDDEALSLVKDAGRRFAGAGNPPATVGRAAQAFADQGMVNQAQVTDAYAADAAQGGPGAFAAPEVSAPASTPAAPPAPVATPGGTPMCKHGPRKFVQGIGKASGKPFKMWACDTPQGTPDQCKPEFVR